MMRRKTPIRSTYHVCPYYRLPQLNAPERSPVCTALEHPYALNRERARALCRTAEHSKCSRYVTASHSAGAMYGPVETRSVSRRMLSSALWIVGIPTVITALIVIAVWFTEHVWVPTYWVTVSFTG